MAREKSDARAWAGIGLLGALVIMRLMNSLLFGVRTTDPVTFIVIALLLSAVALVASYVLARQRVSTLMISLRCQ